jgi:deoxyribonuclease-4
LKFGVHIRTAGGLVKALERAEYLGCETVQLFSGNPNSWVTKPPDPTESGLFCDRCSSLEITPIVLHTPYLLNMASPEDEIWHKSVEALCFAVNKAGFLNADHIVTHIGSHKGAGLEYGVKRIAEAVHMALDCGSSAGIALELGAGSGRSIGSKFSEIAMILDEIGNEPRVGICIDSAHLYGAGYDISTAEGVTAMFDEMERYVGHEKLRVVHLNDTVQELASAKDRHFHIGKGNVGIEGFRAIVNHPYAVNCPGIIETPGDDISFDQENLEALRSLRLN